MSNTISPNMGLVIPGVGTEAGPDYATEINSSLTLIDQHTHAAGSGVPITPSGLNINSDLTMATNNLIAARSVRFTAQSSALALPADLGCLYESGVDLYFNDGSGNQIRLTQGGSIVGTAGSITGLPSGTASASYSSGTFVWQSATSTSAVMDFGSAILRNNTASSKGLTLSPPNAMAVDYSLTLPALPNLQKIMTLDAAGNMSAPYTTDNVTIEVSSNLIQLKDLGITAAKIANLTITGAKIANATLSSTQIIAASIVRTSLAAVGQQISSSSTATNTSSASFTQIANQTVTISTSGRPVVVMLTSDGSSSGGNFIDVGTGNIASIRISSGAGTVGTWSFGPGRMPVSLIGLDPGVGANTYTYIAEWLSNTGGPISMSFVKLVAYEL